jgi:Right handed beta helix region
MNTSLKAWALPPCKTTLAILLLLTCASASGFAVNSYYVSTAGSDSNNGLSTSTAWRHVQYAANHVVAGDTVNILGGVYNETVNIPASGSATAGYITFQNYSGQTATIDGTSLSVPGGQYGLINIASQSYIIIQGLEIRNYKTTSTKYVPVGVYVTGAGSYLHLLNNHIHDIQTTASGCNANALGVAFYGTQAPASLNHITISGNELNNMKTGCSETLTLDGNVDTFTITNNLIHDDNNIGIDAIGFEGVSPNSAYDQARNGYIGENSVYNITSQGNKSYPSGCWCSDGIYVDGGTNITIERNLIHNVDLGIEMASEHSGKTASYITARSNLVYFGNSAGISIGGYAKSVGGSDHVTIVNNTLYKNDGKNTGSGEFQIQFHATNNVFKNNIVYATSQGLLVNSYTASTSNPADVDYNLYYSSVSASNATFLWTGKTYTGFSTYQSKTGKDPNSNYLDPLFVNGTTPDLHVQATSRAVNAGINLGSAVEGTQDYAGNARVQGSDIDIGAYEQ